MVTAVAISSSDSFLLEGHHLKSTNGKIFLHGPYHTYTRMLVLGRVKTKITLGSLSGLSECCQASPRPVTTRTSSTMSSMLPYLSAQVRRNSISTHHSLYRETHTKKIKWNKAAAAAVQEEWQVKSPQHRNMKAKGSSLRKIATNSSTVCTEPETSQIQVLNRVKQAPCCRSSVRRGKAGMLHRSGSDSSDRNQTARLALV